MPAQELADTSLSATVPMSPAALRTMAKRKRQAREIPIVRLVLLIGFLGFWELGARVSVDGQQTVINPFLWSQPTRVAERIWRWATDGTIVTNIWVTLAEAGFGFLIGMGLGIACGFVLGRSDYWARVFQPFIQVMNATPRLIFAPLFFIIFGLDETSKIALTAVVVFFVGFWNAFQGVREIDRNVYNNARMLGASGRQMTFHVLLPSMLSWITSSLHLALGNAMSAAIVGEYLGATRGLGNVISRSEGLFDQTGVMAGLVVLSAVVVLVELSMTFVERRLGKWKPAPAGELLTQ